MESKLDPVTFEVIWNRLLEITEEMGIKYMRTSGSPILVGAYDASTAITLPDGQIVAIGPYITTQAHVLPLIIRSVIERCSSNPGIAPGDMFICNDPYLGATHQPDVATVAPVGVQDDLIAWVGASGHWIDIGGPEPGGFNMNARSVMDEGLRMPPTRIVEGDRIREDLVSLIVNQVRDPMAELDLRGQIVANRAGAQGIRVLCDEYGTALVDRVMREAIQHVARRLAGRLEELPDGVWREVQLIDHDGHEPTIRQIVCTITKSGNRLGIDFTGTDPQSEGFVNCTYGGLRAAVMSAVGIALGWDLPWNEGLAHCVDLTAPEGTAVTATFPAPVSMSTITPIILSLNVVFSALAKMLLVSETYHDEAMANWCGTSMAPTITGLNERDVMTVNGETSHFAAGCGARSYADGVDTGGIIINTTASIPSIEAVESEYPVLYLMRRQMRDSGGPGAFRGGMAGEVALIPYDAHGPLESSFAGCGAEVPNGYGLAGGLPGAAARYLRFQGSYVATAEDRGVDPFADSTGPSSQRDVLSLNSSHKPFPVGVVEYHNWQGGGGFGDPLERDPNRVLHDVRDGSISAAEAERVYGVRVGAQEVDDAGTEQLRTQARRGRLARAVPATNLRDLELEAPNGSPRGASATYGNVVRIDLRENTVSCLACAGVLGPATGDFRAGCVVEDVSPQEAGPARGEDYSSGNVRMFLFYCPHCGRELEAEIGLAGGMRSGFMLSMSEQEQ